MGSEMCIRDSLLAELESKFKLGVITNFTYAPAMEKILSSLGILEHLDVKVISHEVGWRKPHPEIFLTALRRLKIKPDEALFVGDDPKDDVVGAKKVGLTAALVFKPGNADKRFSEAEVSPDLKLQTVCEVKDILDMG